jgi:hypothetical protein
MLETPPTTPVEGHASSRFEGPEERNLSPGVFRAQNDAETNKE